MTNYCLVVPTKPLTEGFQGIFRNKTQGIRIVYQSYSALSRKGTSSTNFLWPATFGVKICSGLLTVNMKEEQMIIERLEVGAFAANCYLVGDEESKEGIIIDPGAEPDTILKKVKNSGIKIESIVLTHAHGDHFGALEEVKKTTGAEVAIHTDDARIFQSRSPAAAMLRFSAHVPPPPDRPLKGGDTVKVGSLSLLVLHTPGHTPGGICLLGEKVVFTGDTLFNLGIGRTDFPGGSYRQLMDSIHTKLMVLPDSTTVYPGHGPETTIGEERKRNPFLRD
jgi:hydroxyacylglutathione hydrolase